MLPLIILRPEPGASASLAAARDQGLDAHAAPLFRIAPVAWQAPSADAVDALLLGSANAARHGGADLARFRSKPAYVVGAGTAAAARAAGLTLAATGSGGLQAVLDGVAPSHKRLLRLAGEIRVPLVPPPGKELIERTVYAAQPLPLDPAMVARLQQPAVVALHSAEVARRLAALCTAHGIARARLRLAAIGPRVRDAAGSGWAETACAAQPDDAALLALAARMCQSA